MKRTLSLLCTLVFSLNFAYAQTDSSTKNILKTQEYQSALKLFQQKNYEKALVILESLVNKYPQNEKISFYYARSAFELKKYEFAFAAYDRILILNPTNHRARLELARTLFMMKSYKESKKEFETVLIAPIPVVVRQNVEKFLEAIETKEKNYIFNKVAIFGFGWDDNINNNTYEKYSEVGGREFNNDTDKISDTNFKAILVANLIVPNKSHSQFSWESTVIGYMQEQNHHHDNDIALTSFSSGMGYAAQKFKNLFSFNYDHIWVGGDQTLRIYGITNTIKYNTYKKQLLTMNLKYKKKQWIKEEDSSKDSNIKELSLNYTLPIEKTKDSVEFFTSYIIERLKKDVPDTNVDKNTKKYKLKYSKDLFKTYNVSVGYQLEKNDYKVTTASVNLKRKDDTKTAILGISTKVNKSDTVAIEYNNIENKSNINVYTYKRKSVNLNYTLVF